jgi:CheY-like chemotaxis protein
MSGDLRVAVVAADPGVAEVAGLFLQQIECELDLAQVVGEGTLAHCAVGVVCVSSLDQARQFIPPTREALGDPPMVIAFGRGIDAHQAVELGALAFVPTEARPIDLCVIVALAATSAFGDLRISGSAEDYGGVLPLVRALSVARRTGKLEIAAGERRGHVNLFDGELVSVVAEGAKGEPAFHKLLRWDSPRFQFADRSKPLDAAEVFARAEVLVNEAEAARAEAVRAEAARADAAGKEKAADLGDKTQPGMTLPEPLRPQQAAGTPPPRPEPPQPRPPAPVAVPPRPASEPEPAEVIDAGAGGVLLYVDGSVTMQTCAEITFRTSEMIYVGAHDSAQALTLARQYQPSIILAAEDLEGMSGYDLCQAIKHDPQLADVPVLIVRGQTREYDERRGRDAGADGVVTKPWDTGMLVERVRQVLAADTPVAMPAGGGAARPRRATPPMGSRAPGEAPQPAKTIMGMPSGSPPPPPEALPPPPGGAPPPPGGAPLPPPQYHFPPSPRSGEPVPGGHDRVDCTVFAPKACVPDEPFMVQAFLHLPSGAMEAAAMAREFDDDAHRRGTTNLQADLPRGAHLTFELSVRGGEVFDPVESLRWVGATDSVQFEVVPHEETRVVMGRLLVSMAGVPIGTIRFKVANDPRMAQTSGQAEPTGEAHRYRYAFISYASEDRAEVMRRVQMLASLRIEFFQDILDLDPGDRWEAELYRQIDRADVFFLFWSSAAAHSRWVLREVRYAVARKGGSEEEPPDILPIVVERSGRPPQPPDDLAHLHFGDRIAYLLPAMG